MLGRTARAVVVSCVCLAGTAHAAENWAVEGLKQPESVEHDAMRGRYYVSNVDGDPTAADGKGSISIINADDRALQADWVTGLNAPKGLVLSGETLYTADIDHLVAINVETGAIKGRYAAPGAQFLNDVDVANDGRIFITDMLANAIYVFDGDSIDLWLQSDALLHPNGIRVDGTRLVVAAWGDEILPDFTTPTPGHLITVDLSTKTVSSVGSGTPVGNLDGLAGDGAGQWLASDWIAGAVYRIDTAGKAKQLMDLNQGSADIEVVTENGRLHVIVPMMNDNRVVSYTVE